MAIAFFVPGLFTYIPLVVFAFDEFMLSSNRIEWFYLLRISFTLGDYLHAFNCFGFFVAREYGTVCSGGSLKVMRLLSIVSLCDS